MGDNLFMIAKRKEEFVDCHYLMRINQYVAICESLPRGWKVDFGARNDAKRHGMIQRQQILFDLVDDYTKVHETTVVQPN